MHRPSALRGGDEGDLLKQIMLLELLDWLAPQQGEFWYLESHAAGGRQVADLPALDWCARATEEGDNHWASYPLWGFQREAMVVGEYLSSAGLALQRLQRWATRGISVRWVFGHGTPRQALRFQEHCQQWSEEGRISVDERPHTPRIFHVTGGGFEALQELVYLGGARAPGVAVLAPPSLDHSAALHSLLETLLLRRFWVLLSIPTEAFEGKERTAYKGLLEGVEGLEFPGYRYSLEGRTSSWKPKARFEHWLLSPGREMEGIQARIWERIGPLFGRALGRKRRGDRIAGMEVIPFSSSSHHLHEFELLLPFPLQDQLEIDRARESDLTDIIHLWEKLMDEHATFDEHFQRRPLARLYLRHSFSSQQNQPDYLLLVARWKRKPIGFLSAQILRAPLFQESRLGQIVDVFLLPEWRDQQIGSRFVQLAHRWFQAKDIRQIDLNVAVHNPRGKSFWERQGFRPYLHVVSKEMD